MDTTPAPSSGPRQDETKTSQIAHRAIGLLAWLVPILLLTTACAAPQEGSVAVNESSQPTPPAAPASAEYLAEIDTWRAEREAGLRQDDGWLTLVGLHWLEDGDNRFGSDPASDLVFPDKAPARCGNLALREGVVTLAAAADSGLVIGSEPVERSELAADSSGEATLVELGDLSFHIIERAGRFGVRVKDRQSPVLTGFQGLESFPVDPELRIEARFEPYAEPHTLPIPDVLGNINDSPSPGKLVFELGGATHTLDPLGEPGSPLFIVFGDQTNGKETYGGGRFLSAEPPDENGRVILDFNKAYNPPCVFTAYATCPVPPASNRLKAPVRAGETTYVKAAHG